MTDKERIFVDDHEILIMLQGYWTAVPHNAMTGSYEALPDSTDSFWMFSKGDKALPLTRFKQSMYRFTVYKSGDKWEIGVVEKVHHFGARISRQSPGTGRWGSANDEARRALVEFVTRPMHQLPVQIFEDAIYHVRPTDDELLCLRVSGLKVKEVNSYDNGPITSIPKWLQDRFGIDPTTKKMQEAMTKLEEIKLRYAPVPVEVEFLSGKEITDAYSSQVGGHSCMTGKENAYLTEMYAMNPGVVRLAVIKDRKAVTGRCLVWTVTTPDGRTIWYPDRSYPAANQQIEAKFRVSIAERAKREGVEVRWLRDWETDTPRLDEWVRDGTAPVFVMNLPRRRVVPYMDTLVYGALVGPTKAVFARSKKLVPYHPTFNPSGARYPAGTVLAEGQELVVPVIEPRRTGGGVWLTNFVKCKTDGCDGEVDTRPITGFTPSDPSGQNIGKVTPALVICDACLRDRYVKVWSPRNEELLRLRTRCEWSDHLKAWVEPGTETERRWLMRHEDGQWMLRPVPEPLRNPYQVDEKLLKAMQEAVQRAGLRV